MSIEIKNLCYTYMPGTPFEEKALKNIDLTIEDGDFVGLIGHTGSGKSTLLQIMAGLLKPTSGSVIIDGKDIFAKKADRKWLRRSMGVVFQYPEYQLFDDTVEKDISFGPKMTGVPEEEIPERVKEAMALVELDYDEFAGKSPFELSGGQKRKAALAGVLATRPKIMLMDEPVAGLDPIGRESLMQLTKRLNSMGVTIVMISHNMEGLAENANKIIALKEGEIILKGTPKEVFSRHDEIYEMGLGLPEAAHMVYLMNKKGMDVPIDIINEEELKNYLIKRFGGAV
ncbi:MAG: energy-coupling factor transporter ATPase [Christensenellaceae bacterium]|nr:energy-coupling factor transporter ATPase [Christensenellaceae bacterium]